MICIILHLVFSLLHYLHSPAINTLDVNSLDDSSLEEYWKNLMSDKRPTSRSL